jgi:hypothetical protein
MIFLVKNIHIIAKEAIQLKETSCIASFFHLECKRLINRRMLNDIYMTSQSERKVLVAERRASGMTAQWCEKKIVDCQE